MVSAASCQPPSLSSWSWLSSYLWETHRQWYQPPHRCITGFSVQPRKAELLKVEDLVVIWPKYRQLTSPQQLLQGLFESLIVLQCPASPPISKPPTAVGAVSQR